MRNYAEGMFQRLRGRRWRLVGIPARILLVFGGLIGFLPLVGFWMLPLGFASLAVDVPIAGNFLRKLEKLWHWRRRS
jgi:hypothetical protein